MATLFAMNNERDHEAESVLREPQRFGFWSVRGFWCWFSWFEPYCDPRRSTLFFTPMH